MIGEILGKALISVKADTSQAKAAIKDLSATEQKAARERVEAQEKINNAWDASLKKHAFVVAGVTAGVAIAIASVKKYEQHLKDIGDTGSGEFQRIQRASEAATKAQDNLQIAIGRLVLAATPAVEALAAMAMELGNIVDGVGRLVRGATSLIPGGGGSAKTVGKWAARGAFGLAGIGYGVYQDHFTTPDQYLADTNNMGNPTEGVGGYGEFGQESIHPNVAKALGWKYVTGPDGGYWRPPTDAEKAERERKAKGRARDARRQADIYADAWRSISGEIDATSGRARGGGMVDVEGLISVGDTATEGGNLDQFGEYEMTSRKSLDASIRAAKELGDSIAQRESLLASIFGPVEEFEVYSDAWRGLEEVVTAGFSAWIDGSKSVGAAMKEALHGFAKQLAGEALLQALRHGAYALGSLAFGDPRGAAQHGIAAAKWGAVAVAAGVVGKVTAPSQGGGGSSSNSYAAAGIGTGGGSRDGVTSLTIVMGDQFAGDSPRYVARKVRRNVGLARQYADYEEQGN